MKTVLNCLLAMAMAGCASTPVPSHEDGMEATIPLTCRGADQCALYWRRAQAWIAQNSDMKIQLATDTVLETYTPAPDTGRRGFRLVREPGAGGVERILIATSCPGYLPCRVHQFTTIAAIKRYVRGPDQ